MTQDEALKAAGDILIAAFPTLYGSINYNMQGPRKDVLPKVTSQQSVITAGGVQIPVDIVANKRL